MRTGRVQDGQGRCILPRVRRAANAWERMRGLLGRPPLEADEGFWIEPCSSVHTVGMKFPIDVLFVDAQGNVKKTVAALKPLRASASIGAAATLELEAGALQRLGLLDEAAELFWEEEA